MSEFILPITTCLVPLIAFGWASKYFVQKEDYKEDKSEFKDSIKMLEYKIDTHHSKILEILTKGHK